MSASAGGDGDAALGRAEGRARIRLVRSKWGWWLRTEPNPALC